MPRIHIENTGAVIEASPAVSVLNNILRAGVRIAHKCGGKAQCGTCRYTVIEGAENISPPTKAELMKLKQLGNPEGVRLGCQSYVRGDLRLKVTLLNA